MAKNKAAKKKPSPKPKSKPKPKPRKSGPRSQVLPGMEQVRNIRLDRLCESIGEAREQMNRLRQEEKGDAQMALREMHDQRVEVYRHAGVELVRVPGEEKLRVRTTKEDASDITEDAEGAEVAERGRDDEGENE